MPFDKAKALQEAHKYVSQGKTAKAIKQYEWIVENDPGDLILLNFIGDLYARENNVPEALKNFYRLADAYIREGYKVKAIAIYKKIAKLDRDSVDPLLRLAELNLSQGLANEAREHFKSALDFFERNGQKVHALEILRKLCRLDPKNHGLRLNLAQAAEGALENREAAEAYLGAAVLARENGDVAAGRSALSKAAELAPENTEVLLLRARQALTDQQPEDIGEILNSVPALQSSPEAKRLLLESYLAANNLGAAGGLLIDVLELNPSNFAPAADFTTRCIEKGEYESAFQIMKGAAPILISRRETGPLMEALVRLCKACPEPIEILEFTYHVAEQAADEGTIPEILEAMGEAYVRSGHVEKAEQAYACLVAREPENETYKDQLRIVLEKQGREFLPPSRTPLMSANAGPEFEAVSEQKKGAAGLPPDTEHSATRAESLSSIPEAILGQSTECPGLFLRPVEINLSQAVNGQGTHVEEKEIPPPKEISLDFQSPQEEKLVSSGNGIDRDESSAGKAPRQSPAEQVQPQEAPPFNYEDNCEEMEFYLRHKFYNEARKAVEELERKYPGECRVSEFRQRVDLVARESSPPEKTPSAPAMGEQVREKNEWDLPTSFLDSATAAGRVGGDLTPTVFRADVSRADLTEVLADNPDSTMTDFNDPPMSPSSSARKAGRGAGPGSVADASAELGSLLDDLDEENESVDQAADDEQTHYNLGVAFWEMGLLDEAIGEFQKVVTGTGSKQSRPHFLQGCTLLASCFMAKEMPAIAAKWYLRALDAPGLDYEGTLALYYDLGVAFEKAGDTAAALEKFTEVYSQNIDYRDVAEKIRLLRQTSR